LKSLTSTFRSEVAGPVLITGESGSGKTRLWNRLADELPDGWRFAVVAVSPALGPLDFLALAAAQLGAAASDRLAANRLAVASALRDEDAEGRSWALVVENAHHASPDVLSELEALCEIAGRRGRPGFSAVLVVGRTELVRRLAIRPLQSFASRLAAHIHLPPLDVEEAAELLATAHLGRFDLPEIEELHRDAAGNPRSLLKLAEPRRMPRPSPQPQALTDDVESPAPRPATHRAQPPATAPNLESALQDASRSVPVMERSSSVEPAVDAPPLVPSRPPLREEEGLIEVGWSGSLEAEEDPADEADEPDEGPAIATAPLGEEAIEDRYAALQAWTEWARNRGRVNPLPEPADETAEDSDEDAADELAPGSEGGSLGPDVRVESEHEHAPYSQLFTRLRQSS